MAEWLQHLLVLALVGLSAALVLWQTLRTLRGRGGNVGSCCSKGCSPAESQPTSSEPSRQSPTKRIVFMPVEMLTRKR